MIMALKYMHATKEAFAKHMKGYVDFFFPLKKLSMKNALSYICKFSLPFIQDGLPQLRTGFTLGDRE